MLEVCYPCGERTSVYGMHYNNPNSPVSTGRERKNTGVPRSLLQLQDLAKFLHFLHVPQFTHWNYADKDISLTRLLQRLEII